MHTVNNYSLEYQYIFTTSFPLRMTTGELDLSRAPSSAAQLENWTSIAISIRIVTSFVILKFKSVGLNEYSPTGQSGICIFHPFQPGEWLVVCLHRKFLAIKVNMKRFQGSHNGQTLLNCCILNFPG